MGKKLKIYSPGADGKRKCGPCSACCTALQVPDLEKGEFVRCSHLRKGTRARYGACGIYAERPPNCRTWICGWLRGLGGRHHRPDKSGVVLDVEESKAVQGYVVKVWEMKPGAAEKPANRELVESVAGVHSKPTIAIVFLPGGARRLIGGNPEGVRRATAILNEAHDQGVDLRLEVEREG